MTRPTFYVYRARDGWRWRLRAVNGRLIAESGEAYSTRWGCQRAARLVRDVAGAADILPGRVV